MDTTTMKDKLARFGRDIALLLNRGLMYQRSHPLVKESIKEVHKLAEKILVKISPLVLILNRDQFYVDEEQVDPRINVKRIATLFKKNKIQSISFESGLTQSELDIFIGIFASMTMATDAEEIKKMLFSKGAFNIKVNHVLYKKVTAEDQIISREALKEVTPAIEDEDSQSRKKFMDTLLETILTEEFAKTLNIKSLLANPKLVSQNMIKADLAGAQQDGSPSGARKRTGNGTLVLDGSQEGPAPGGAGPGQGYGAGPEGLGSGFGTAMGPAGTGQVAESVAAAQESGAYSGHGGPGTGGAAAPGRGVGTVDVTGQGPGTGATASGTGGVVGLSATVSATETALRSGTHRSTAGPNAGIGEGAASGPGSGRGVQIGAGLDSELPPEFAAHGTLLLRQLEIIQAEVQKQLQGKGDVSLEDLADAVFEMKKQFFEELQTQKALGIAYANEAAIVGNINQLTDQVILRLIQEEYSEGKITTQRLAQIILRLIPDPQELRRLLPQVKEVLIAAGMAPTEYLELIEQLKKVLQNEDLVRILEESSEAIGVDSEELIDEFKKKPDQAAKLIYLASEISKGTGDEAALADILVEYVEKMTTQAAMEAGEAGTHGDDHLKKVVTNVESTLLRQLSKLNVGDDVLRRMENRINERMDSILDKMRVEWLNAKTGTARKEKQIRLSVLQTLEHSVGEEEELAEMLKAVRVKVEAGEIEENNYTQIDAEITAQRKILKKEAEALEMPEGVLDSDELMFILKKEVARVNRYNAPFSALAFSFVSAKPKMKTLKEIVTAEAIMSAALEKLAGTIREVDYIGQIGKNKIVALLPMIAYPSAKSALIRVLNLLHAKPLKVHDVPVDLRVAGVVAQFDPEHTPDALAFAKQLSNQLMDMVARVKNIQVLF